MKYNKYISLASKSSIEFVLTANAKTEGASRASQPTKISFFLLIAITAEHVCYHREQSDEF